MASNENTVVTWCFGKIVEVDQHPTPMWVWIEVEDKINLGLALRLIAHIGDSVKLIGGSAGLIIGGKSCKEPKTGDRVVFIPTIANNNLTTQCWSFREDYEAALAKVLYKCVSIARIAGARVCELEEILFQGLGSELKKFAEDTALSYLDLSEHDSTMYINKYTYYVRWEVSTDSGKTWRICLCPDQYEHFASQARIV